MSKDWRKQGRELTRGKVRKRDDYTCQDCGEIRLLEDIGEKFKKSLDVHHLNGICGKKTRGYDKLADMNDLITLCHKCHYGRHDNSQVLLGKYPLGGSLDDIPDFYKEKGLTSRLLRKPQF